MRTDNFSNPNDGILFFSQEFMLCLNEVQRRYAYGEMARAIGWGGISAVADFYHVSRTTVSKGLAEVDSGICWKQGDRLRRPGAGRKQFRIIHIDVVAYVDHLLDDYSYGDPETIIHYAGLTVEIVRTEISKRFTSVIVSATTIRKIIGFLEYSLQKNRKLIQAGSQHPLRNNQFEYISEMTEAYVSAGDLVFSVDCKNKINIGNYANSGQEYRKIKDPRKVNDHDFLDKEKGKAIPYGIYCLNDNKGYISLGHSHDTSKFAVNSIRWVISKYYPGAKKVLILCDGGGSNSVRSYAWKCELWKLAKDLKIEITVCHYPPGTSKWNKIEHKLFSYISINWKGKPLISMKVIKKLIESTKTKAGLTVKCRIDRRHYDTGIKITKKDLSKVPFQYLNDLEKWNYRLSPKRA